MAHFTTKTTTIFLSGLWEHVCKPLDFYRRNSIKLKSTEEIKMNCMKISLNFASTLRKNFICEIVMMLKTQYLKC